MKTYKINEIEYKRILGRNVRGAAEKEKLNLFCSGSALEFKVSAKEVRASFQADFLLNEIWVSIYLNKREISRFMLERGLIYDFCLVRNLDPSEENLITIYKDTQPMPGDERHSLKLLNVSLDDQGKFLPLEDSNRKSIEFIGDSITSGEGLRGAVSQMEWIPPFFAASRSYAAMVARKLDANFSVMSQCGWGLKWSWDGFSEFSIPPHYKNVCSVIEGDFQKSLGAHEIYDFANGFDAVVINLGTNDNSALRLENPTCTDSLENREIFMQTGIDFLKEIRKYNPSAIILWCYGMIKLDKVPSLIENLVEVYKKETGDKKVFSMQLDSMEELELCEEDKGSRGHPGPKTHLCAAKKITAFLQNFL